MSVEEAAARIREDFLALYGRAPRWIAAAPGRVNVIGEHTDYNGGFVLPMAIERYTLIAAAPNDSRIIRLRSAMANEGIEIDLSQTLAPDAKGQWINYPKGVLAGFIESGLRPAGFDALIHSDVPVGGGLSSSAALEVAMATLLESVIGETLDPVQKALLCQKAEHIYAGMPCGIMDQFVSALGRKNRLLLLDCRSYRSEWVPMLDSGVSVLIVNTNVKHQLTGSEYPARRRQCEAAAAGLGVETLRDASMEQLRAARNALDLSTYRRARHVIGEIERTQQAAASIGAGDWRTAGELMYASHASLRDDYEVSCPELDAVVEIAAGIDTIGGVFGCRMTGGGFGGCAVALVQTAAVPAVMRRIGEEYLQRTGRNATMFVSRPAEGAGLLNA